MLQYKYEGITTKTTAGSGDPEYAGGEER
jgi:hypothetical protein